MKCMDTPRRQVAARPRCVAVEFWLGLSVAKAAPTACGTGGLWRVPAMDGGADPPKSRRPAIG